ncbi:MAG: protein BatD, partial [candidate division Zixibacteria bacterium]|nr:protein BatD [candidate division Zixibacteria bacterium]
SAQPKLSERAADDSGKSRDHFLEAVVDKKSCYVNEQVTYSLKYYVAVRTYGSPELTEPTTTGFWTEVLGNKPPYYQKINGRNYKVIERKYALFPTQTGELTIGRASIRATVQLRSRQFRDPFDAFGDLFGRGEEITDRSQPITVNVKPLPEKGRPKDFTGTIGRFEISADLNKRETEVNQPVSLTIKIRGTGNIKSVAEPEVGDLPDFRVYRASSSENISKQNDRIGGTKIYEEVFIPKRPGRLEIPAITFNYFDPNRGKYIVTSTKPITLNVTKPEGYVASAEVPFVTPDMTIGSEARDIRFIRDDIGDLTPVGSLIVFRPLFLAINGLPVVLLAGMVVARRRREKLAADTGYARSRGASKVAKKRLARARSLAKVEHTEQFYAEIYQALTSYIADKLNISPHGLTTERINELLAQRSASEELTAGVDNVIRKCDFARYASSSITADDIDQSLAEAERIITAMEAIRFA